MKQIAMQINSGSLDDGTYWVDVDGGDGRFEHLHYHKESDALEAVARMRAALLDQMFREIHRAEKLAVRR